MQSKFLYGLAACCFTAAQLRRINGFQARCLRSILHIRPAFYSRISNAIVLQRAQQRPLTEILLDQQLMQFGKVLRNGMDSPLWTAALAPLTLSVQPLVSHYVRRRGRPRKEWVRVVLAAAQRRTNGQVNLISLAKDEPTWVSSMKQQ